MRAFAITAGLVLLAAMAQGEVYYKETFDNGDWSERWVASRNKVADGSAGVFKKTAGKWHGDSNDFGVQTSEANRFYHYTSCFDKFSNKGKDLVLQFSLKMEDKLDCGGAYLKLLPSDTDQQNFNGDSEYHLMFGPDVCGSTKKIHAIITSGGRNHLWKKTPRPDMDQLTHVYSWVIHPDNTYEVYKDLEKVESGSFEEDWEILKPKKIKDPSASKPADWVDDEYIDDPEDVKPADWDDAPAEIADPSAAKPEDWDEEEDGVWKAPTIPNPDFKGEWKAKRIPNPEYKGEWVHPLIDNPEYSADADIYSFDDIGCVGFDLWQVKAKTIFDNIIVTDSWEEAKAHAKATWGEQKDTEKVMFEDIETARKAKEEEEAAKRDAARIEAMEADAARREAAEIEDETDDEWEPAPVGGDTWDEDEADIDAKDEL